MSASIDHPKLHLGTAPDSWGVWMPGGDPLQTPWERYLDEIHAAGYRYSELGPFGYLPTDPGIVRDAYARRGLALTGGTVFATLHQGHDALVKAKADCDTEMAVIGPNGARHVVILPESYTDMDGNLTASPTLTDDEWHSLTTGMSELGRYLADEHDAVLVFHPHADSHVGTQAEIDRFLDSTDPETVQLCLDTGHVAYCGADNLKLIADYPDRIAVRPPQAGRPGHPRPGQGGAPRLRPGRAPRGHGRAAAWRTGHAEPCSPRWPPSIGTSTASSSRTCIRVRSTRRSRSRCGHTSTSRRCGLGAGRPPASATLTDIPGPRPTIEGNET